MKRVILHSEVLYIFANIFMAFSVALLSSLGMGLSMIVSPAFLVSEKIDFLTFGTAEYIVQALFFIVFCIAMKQFRVYFLFSFATCLIYGAMLDLFQLIPFLQTNALIDISWFAKIPLFIGGITLTSFAICLHFRTYLYPQLYDFFVSGLTSKYNLNRAKFKWIFDISMLVISVVMSLAFFGKFVGISYGTFVMAFFNGPIIAGLGNLFDKFFFVRPIFPKFAKLFEIKEVIPDKKTTNN